MFDPRNHIEAVQLNFQTLGITAEFSTVENGKTSKVILMIRSTIVVIIVGLSSVANADEIGRYQVAGEYRLDTKTGEVLKLSELYEEQKKLRAVKSEVVRVVAPIVQYSKPVTTVQPLQVLMDTPSVEDRIRSLENFRKFKR